MNKTNVMRLQEINNKEYSFNKGHQRGYAKAFVWLIEQAERGAFLYFENYASYGHTKIEG